MNQYPSPRELAEEARRVLAANPMTPEEHFEFLVARGIIDRNGRVICMKLFGDDPPAQEPAAPIAPIPAAGSAEASPDLLPRRN